MASRFSSCRLASSSRERVSWPKARRLARETNFFRSVMMIEHVTIDHAKVHGQQVQLLPSRKLKPGESIVAKGAQACKGDELLPVGTVIHSAQIALAATCGYSTLQVFARPRVAILATGDELVPVDTLPAPGQIRNSNAPMLTSAEARV